MKRLASFLKRTLIVIGYAVLGLAVLWSVMALWRFDVIPVWFSRILALVWLVASVLMFTGIPLPKIHRGYERLPREVAIFTTLIGVTVVVLVWRLKTPEGKGPWNKNQEKVVVVRFENETITIENFRNTQYRSVTDYDTRWETRAYDLNKIRTLDVITEPFMSLKGMSHLILSFGFEDGEQVAVSIESRKEDDSSQGMVRSLFKGYELFYAVGDERDILHHRMFQRNHEIHLYPIDFSNRAQLRAFFVLMMNHAASMDRRPRFYNTVSDNCTNVALRHLEYLLAADFPWFDYRLALPGYLGEFLYENGGIDSDLSLEQVEATALVDPTNLKKLDGVSSAEWSKRLRSKWRKVTPGSE